jgi:glutathione-regulated potassium-efflux system ancillary protein KefF
MICVIHAHPYLHRSHANRILADALRAIPNLDLRSLYDLYPDFDIDVAAEQQALARAELVVWMHPVFWYSVPALLKHWFDKVLAYGFAYGEGGSALRDKHCLWVPTNAGTMHEFAADGMHAQPFEAFIAPIAQTARFCGMHWENPHVVYGASSLDDAHLADHAAAIVERLTRSRAAATKETAGLAP